MFTAADQPLRRQLNFLWTLGWDLTENSSQPEVNKFLLASNALHGRTASPEVITFLWPDLESMWCLTELEPRKVCKWVSVFFLGFYPLFSQKDRIMLQLRKDKMKLFLITITTIMLIDALDNLFW